MLRVARLSAILFLFVAPPAWSASWSLGSHFGLGFVDSRDPGVGSTTVLAWPSNTLSYQPALRIGLSDETRTHSIHVDTGLLLIDQGGSNLSLFVVSAHFERALFPDWNSVPFVNLGTGLYREGSPVQSSTTHSYGGGVGLRHYVSERHGALRVEARVDHLRHDNIFGRPALTTYGLRLGFDLWL